MSEVHGFLGMIVVLISNNIHLVIVYCETDRPRILHIIEENNLNLHCCKCKKKCLEQIKIPDPVHKTCATCSWLPFDKITVAIYFAY